MKFIMFGSILIMIAGIIIMIYGMIGIFKPKSKTLNKLIGSGIHPRMGWDISNPKPTERILLVIFGGLVFWGGLYLWGL